MKDVISVDKIFKQFAVEAKNVHDSWYIDGELTMNIHVFPVKAQLHSLLISKLPEKRDEGFGEVKAGMEDMYIHNKGFNSAIDDTKAVLDEMFGVGDE